MRPIADLVGSELGSRLLAASPQQQRDAALAAATAATLATGLAEALTDRAFGDLLQDRYSPGMRSVIEAIEADLDESAWQLQASIERGHGSPGAYDPAFRRARAAGAVKTCFDLEPREALNETIYEAAHATSFDERLPQLLSAVLDLVNPGNHWGAQEIARLFWPEFVEIDGYVLLASHYSPENLSSWRNHRPDSRAAVENVINHVHLEDLAMEHVEDATLMAVGGHLAAAWRRVLDAELEGVRKTV